MCRANNTVRIHFAHIMWSIDSYLIYFAQQKGDHLGLTEKFPRNMYYNPYDHITCPLFAIAVYLTTFGLAVDPNGRLFPGQSQYRRFSDLMMNMLKDHEDEVIAMGYTSISDLGTHSIWKGATRWLSGQPGGPSAMSTCIQGGWSLGGVKDVYMTYEAEGDHFCGRMLLLLPLLQAGFAASPPTFKMEGCTLDYIYDAVKDNYMGFENRGPMAALLQCCLGCLANHKDTIMSLPMSHHCQQNIAMFKDASMLDILSSDVKIYQP